MSQGGLYAFAAIHVTTTWAKHGSDDAHEDADHIGWAVVCKTLVLGAPCRATRLDLGNLEAGGISQFTSIDRDDFRVAAIENSVFVLKSTAVGRPSLTVDTTKETIAYASRRG